MPSLRQLLFESRRSVEPEFRWRSREVSRLEGLSDAVLGFALTLLVVSLEVPNTSAELMEVMQGFLGFALTSSVIFSVWQWQWSYFRRYGLEDDVVVWLNAALLFVVLFFTYPLKFLFSRLTGSIFAGRSLLHEAIAPEHARWFWLAYVAGFVAVYLVFALLYLHAYRHRKELELTPYESFETIESLRKSLDLAALGASLSPLLLLLSGTDDPADSPGKTLVFLAMLASLTGAIWATTDYYRSGVRRKAFRAGENRPK